ncbi:MAG: hypothetical protein NTU73_13950 [Ignavibacteriae bacterium]|nr:hypothetical protein [Ignavibacteriota bacterium]
MKKLQFLFLIILASSIFYSCSEDVVTTIGQVFNYKITAKNRLDSAYAQAQRKLGSSAKLFFIFGKNVICDGTDNGKTDISLYSGITDPNQIGAWLYFFKKTGSDSTIAIYTPNPLPGAKDCIELTSVFSINTVLSLITDTSAKSIVSGALNMFSNSNFTISTSKDSIIDSDVSYGYSYSSNPIIKFDASFIPSQSTNNGQTFFASGTSKTVNMFLIPALGTLRLDMPQYIQNLVNFPNDLWIVNYKKLNGTITENFIVGTIVKTTPLMGINIPPGFTSKAINLSKYSSK